MKILHICSGWPLSFKGGITNYVRALAESQFKNGENVYVLGTKDTENYDFKYITYTSKIRPFTYCRLTDKKSLYRIRLLLEEENFDIIHIHTLAKIDWDIYDIIKKYHYIVSLHDYCFICPRIYMYSKNDDVCESYDENKCTKCISYLERFRVFRRGIPIINNVLSTNFKIPYIKQNIAKIRHKKFINLLNNADYLLPVSYKVEEIYKKAGVTAKSKVLHIGNISADNFQEQFEYNLEEHAIKMVFLGRLTNYKGADLFISLSQKLKSEKNIEFHFLGNAGEYEKRIKDAGIINHGKYDPKQLSDILKNFDIGMVLSIWHDNGPQVVMELLNNHIPVIGTKMGGIPDFIVNDNTGFLFDPYSEKEIDALIEWIKNLNVKKIYEMKSNIRPTKTTKQHFDELMEVYNEVIK